MSSSAHLSFQLSPGGGLRCWSSRTEGGDDALCPRSAPAQDLPKPKCGEDSNLFEHCCEGLSVCFTPSYTSASAIGSPAWQGSQPKATDNSSRVGLQFWVLLIVEYTEGLTP